MKTLIGLVLILLGACTPASIADLTSADRPPETGTAASPIPDPTSMDPESSTADVQINNRIDDPTNHVFAQLLPFDGINPVYEPVFSGAAEAPFEEDELVIGITLEGEAKAYPITILRFREMVNDELAGIPILVTW